MANGFKFELNRKGVGEILKSEAMGNICLEHAQAVAARAGDGFVADKAVGKTRVNAMVKPDDAKAYYENLHDNRLLKALG